MAALQVAFAWKGSGRAGEAVAARMAALQVASRQAPSFLLDCGERLLVAA
jgi:hypothetical protein